MVFSALKQPEPIINKFDVNDVVFKIIASGLITHYVVSKVVGENSIECKIFDRQGNLTDSKIRFSSSDFDDLYFDVLATKLLKTKNVSQICL